MRMDSFIPAALLSDGFIVLGAGFDTGIASRRASGSTGVDRDNVAKERHAKTDQENDIKMQ